MATDFTNRALLSLLTDACKLEIAMGLSVFVSERFIHMSWSHFLCKCNTKSANISQKWHNMVLKLNYNVYHGIPHDKQTSAYVVLVDPQ